MELVHHKKYKQHQEACWHRQVICPSNFCDKMMAFSEVKEHAGTCQDISNVINRDFPLFQLSEEKIQNKDAVTWNSQIFIEQGATFFLQAKKEDDVIYMDVVMLGSKEQCEVLTAKVSFINPVTEKVFYESNFSPRPIAETNNTEDFSLMIRQRSIARGWYFHQKTKSYMFEVKVKVVRQ